jgi:putative transposase
MAGDKYHITHQQDTYFITCTIVQWIDLFTRVEYKQIIVEAFQYCILNKGLVLNGWVIMTNHIHFIARCEEPHKISDFLRDFKKFTSKKLVAKISEIPESRREWLLDKFNFIARSSRRAENYKVWKDGNHAINLQYIDVFQKLDYIHNNPIKAGIVYHSEDYVYSSAADYMGNKGLIAIELL